MAGSYWIETLGCPKNAVDSDKLAGVLAGRGLAPAPSPDEAGLVVVNTCAFIEAARAESVEVVLDLAERRRPGARLVVTGCLAERSGAELAEALPEVDAVVGFGGDLFGDAAVPTAAPVPVTLGPPRRAPAGDPAVPLPALDLLTLPRPAPSAPWAYVKVAEGCDRTCGFCAIPQFRGRQRSRARASILDEVDGLVDAGVREVVLVAQDLASWGRDLGLRADAFVDLVGAVAERADRVRLLYLYPTALRDALVDAVCATGVPYFDLSLQHVSEPLLRRMRRPGDAATFLERIEAIRRREPDAAFRSSFLVGYPGETDADHEALLAFVDEAQLDWHGVFAFSPEEGTYAADLDGAVPGSLVSERVSELGELADRITAERRDALIGSRIHVLVDAPGVARSHREAPEIDGVVVVPEGLAVGRFADVSVVGAAGPDLEAIVEGE